MHSDIVQVLGRAYGQTNVYGRFLEGSVTAVTLRVLRPITCETVPHGDLWNGRKSKKWFSYWHRAGRKRIQKGIDRRKAWGDRMIIMGTRARARKVASTHALSLALEMFAVEISKLVKEPFS